MPPIPVGEDGRYGKRRRRLRVRRYGLQAPVGAMAPGRIAGNGDGSDVEAAEKSSDVIQMDKTKERAARAGCELTGRRR